MLFLVFALFVEEPNLVEIFAKIDETSLTEKQKTRLEKIKNKSILAAC